MDIKSPVLEKPRSKEIFLLILCLLIGFTLRFYAFDQKSLWLDEVHTLKNPQTIRHKRIMDLVQGWGDIKLICATGTAIDGNPKSGWTPIKLVENPTQYFPSYYEFCRHFIEYGTKYFYNREVKVEIGGGKSWCSLR
jgi:hypothetical protein